MTKSLSLAAIVLATSIFSTTAFGRNVWRECGIGGMLFSSPDYAWAAIISNVTWDMGTTATSSAVTSPDLCEGSKASAAQFIYQNYAVLEEETAAGQGVHLSAVLGVLNCHSQSHEAVVGQVRSGLLDLVSQPQYGEKTTNQKAEDYYNLLIQALESGFSSECRLS